MSRMRERYVSEVMPALRKEFGYRSVMAIPKLEKIVVNMGLGEATFMKNKLAEHITRSLKFSQVNS